MVRIETGVLARGGCFLLHTTGARGSFAVAPAGARVVRVLIVDDSDNDRKLIERSLSLLVPRPEVEHASTGAECLEKQAANGYDLVFLDFNLPDATGLDVLRRIRSRDPGQPVVMITALGSEVVAAEAIRAGADDYVIKHGDYAPLLPVVVKRIQEKVRLREERRSIEKERQREEVRKRFVTIVENMAEGVVLTNEQHEVEIVNPAARRMLGMSDDEPEMNLTEILLTKLGFSPEDLVRREGSGETRRTIEILNNVYSCILTRVVGDEGTAPAIVMVLRDVTKERQIDRIRADFVSFASHELRTPLTAIKNAVDIVVRGMAGPTTETQMRFLKIASESSNRLARLIDDILDFSRIESGRMELRRRDVDTLAVLGKVNDVFLPQARAKPVTLEKRLPAGGLPHLYADPDRLAQIVSNLLNNAIKFTPAGGRVLLEAKVHPWEVVAEEIGPEEIGRIPQAQDVLEIKVSDTGPGITRDEQKKIFDIYKQIGSQYRDHGGGTGLGLPITRHLVALHHGVIRLKSEVDKGSEFKVLIPVLHPESIFRAELTRDLNLARENRSFLSLVFARFAPAEGEWPIGEVKEIAKQVREIASGVLYRDTDQVESRPRDGGILAILKLRDTSKNGATIVADRVIQAFSDRTLFADGKPVVLSPSIRTVTYPDDGSTAEDLLHAAGLGDEV